MFQTLLVPLDGSEFGERSLHLARQLAQVSSGTLKLVRVQAPLLPTHLVSSTPFEYEGLDLTAYEARFREEATAYLQSVKERLEAEGFAVTAEVLDGKIAETLAKHVKAAGADCIVMTTHGRSGINRMWLGSVTDGVVRHVSVPVLLLHPGDDDHHAVDLDAIDRVLVPLDGSELSEAVLGPAADFAKLAGARLTLTHVVSSHSVLGVQLFPLLPDDVVVVREKAEEYLAQTAERLRADGLQVDTHIAESDSIASTVAAAAEELDAKMIALATHGYGGLTRSLLGSVADKMLRISPRPLLVLRPDGAS